MEITRVARIVGIGILAYVGLVVVVESALGLLQPDPGDTFVITTTDAEGVSSDRILSQNWSGSQLYASANHWPRAWYRAALANPQVKVTLDGVTADYVAVPVDEAEYERVDADIGNPIAVKFLFGFAPQRYLRLDPVGSAPEAAPETG
ncbi:MAG: hypothetical protein QNK05_06725 [Myxococcota bacterium]|nr:hypothetical protein [Myxococcota bacterium]